MKVPGQVSYYIDDKLQDIFESFSPAPFAFLKMAQCLNIIQYNAGHYMFPHTFVN